MTRPCKHIYSLFLMKIRLFMLFLVSLSGSNAFAVNATNANDACYHNNVRNALSYGSTLTNLGNPVNPNRSYNFALQNRPASPLATVQNSTSLKNSAASVASSCTFAHSGLAGVGENLFVGTEAPGTSSTKWLSDRNWWVNDAVNDWTYEATIASYPSGSSVIKCNDGSTGSACRSKIGHYTQIMWNDSTQVGCAAQYCPGGVSNFSSRESTLIVCHYSPQGNFYNGTDYLAPYLGIGIQAPAPNAPASASCSTGATGSSSGGNAPISAVISLLLGN